MVHEPVVIPEKIYFKIGEVCELVGVQAHVLRYWETEFPMLSPQKNKSGQRSYRRRDVEIALKIKQLLYNEMFTIAGAKKKLQADQRAASKPKTPATPEPERPAAPRVEAPTLFDNVFETEPARHNGPASRPPASDKAAVSRDLSGVEPQRLSASEREVLKTVATHLLELRDMLKSGHSSSAAG